MVSTFTVNKGLEKPAHGDAVDSWDIPVNLDWDEIDTAFGGSSLLNSTGMSGDTALVVAQYRPLSLLISGTPTGTITYVVPSGVGGQWVFLNGTAGGQTVGIKSGAGGSTITVAAGLSALVSCDGSSSGMRRSISEAAIAAGASGQIQFNNGSGVMGATAGLVWAGATLGVTGAVGVVGNVSVTGAVSVSGNVGVTGSISASGAITSTTGGFVFPDATIQRTAAMQLVGSSLNFVGQTVLDFPTVAGSYSHLYIVLSARLSIAAASLLMQFYDGAGVLDAGGTAYYWIGINYNNTGVVPVGATTNGIAIGTNMAAGNPGYSGNIWINNIQSASSTQSNWQANWFDSDLVVAVVNNASGVRPAVGPIDGFRITLSGGTMNGSIWVYAV